MRNLKRRRRARLRAQPFPGEWLPFLTRVPLYPFLPPQDQRELEGDVLAFLGEKRFEGAGGFTITDEARVRIAGNACLLLLHRETDFFPTMRTVIVYPNLYRARFSRPGPVGLEEGVEVRAGESWSLGAVVLAWEAVVEAGLGPGARNVVIHEFAHQLDLEDWAMEGAPALPRHLSPVWAQVFSQEYARLQGAQEADTVLALHGALNPAEFFAVATECFFTDPEGLRLRHPRLYLALLEYFHQDPAALLA